MFGKLTNSYCRLVTSPTPNQRLRCRFPNLTIGFSWLFPFRVLHHLPSRAKFLPYDPGRPIAQAVSVPHSPCVLLSLRKRMENTPTYCVREASRREVFTQLQNRAHLTRSFWLEPLYRPIYAVCAVHHAQESVSV